MISSACGLSLFKMIFNMTLLGWLIRLMVLYFWHSCKLPFFGSVITKDWVHVVGHSPVFQILLHIEVRMSIMAFPPVWTNSSSMLSMPAEFPIFSALTASSTSSRRIGWYSSSCICGQSNSRGVNVFKTGFSGHFYWATKLSEDTRVMSQNHKHLEISYIKRAVLLSKHNVTIP